MYLHDLKGKLFNASNHSSVAYIVFYYASYALAPYLYSDACVIIFYKYSGYTVFNTSKKYLRHGPLFSL